MSKDTENKPKLIIEDVAERSLVVLALNGGYVVTNKQDNNQEAYTDATAAIAAIRENFEQCLLAAIGDLRPGEEALINFSTKTSKQEHETN